MPDVVRLVEVIDAPIVEDSRTSRATVATDIVRTLALNTMLHPQETDTTLLGASSWVEEETSRLGYALISRESYTGQLHPLIDAILWTIDREKTELATQPTPVTLLDPDVPLKESVAQLTEQFDTRSLSLIFGMISKSIGERGAFTDLDRDVYIGLTTQEGVLEWLATHYPKPQGTDEHTGLISITDTPE